MLKVFYFPLIILIFGLLIFSPSFFMSLYGDEWLILWFAKASHYQNIYQANTIWSAYWIEMTVFDVISNIFGYQGIYYYLFSFGCRFFSALVLFWFFLRRKISPQIALIGSVLCIINPIGIENTDWARNFDSYLGIGILVFCIDRLLIFKSLTDFLVFVLGVIFLFLVNPLRSHGNLIVLFLISLIQIVNFKKPLLRIVFPIVVISLFVLFIKLNLFGGHVDFKEFFKSFDFNLFFKSFFANISKGFFPAWYYQPSEILIGLGIVILWKRKILFDLKYIGKFLFCFNLSIAGILIIVSFIKPGWLGVSILISSYLLIFLVGVSFVEFIQKRFSELVQTIFILSLFFAYMLFPAVRQPDFRAPFDHRYLIYSSLILPIICANVLNDVFKSGKYLRLLTVVLVGLVMVGFSYLSWNYLNIRKNLHSVDFSETVWSNILVEVSDFDFNKQRAGVILVADPETVERIGNSVQFGFGFHLGLLKQIWQESQIPYLVIEKKEDLNKLFETGYGSKKYFGKEVIVSKGSIIVLEINNTKVQRIPLEQFLQDGSKQNVNH